MPNEHECPPLFQNTGHKGGIFSFIMVVLFGSDLQTSPHLLTAHRIVRMKSQSGWGTTAGKMVSFEPSTMVPCRNKKDGAQSRFAYFEYLCEVENNSTTW